MPTNRENILQAVRAWLLAALPGVTSNANVIPADDDGPRPALPYLTVQVIVADLPKGTDDRINEISGGTIPTIRARGDRFGTISIQGFGRDTAGWIEVATLRLEWDSIKRALTEAGVTVTTLGGGVTDLSALVDDKIEARYQRDFEIGYAVVDADTEELIPAHNVRYTVSLEDVDPDPDPLVVTIDIAI